MKISVQDKYTTQTFKAADSSRLINVLQNLRKTNPENIKMTDIFIKEISKNSEIAEKPVAKYLCKGSSAFVFDTPDGKILKLTLGNHFPMNRPHQCFDVPVYKKGKAGKIFYYIEEKLYQHSLSEEFVLEVKDMIRKAGFRPYDIHDGDCFQIGLSKTGGLYLLDPECARYKTIFHALLDKLKRFCKK